MRGWNNVVTHISSFITFQWNNVVCHPVYTLVKKIAINLQIASPTDKDENKVREIRSNFSRMLLHKFHFA